MGRFILVLASVLSFSCSTLLPQKAVETQLMQKVYSIAVQGDVKEAYAKLKRAPFTALTEADLKLKRKYEMRFLENVYEPVKVKDPFVKEVILAYRSYWKKVLMKELDKKAGFRYLYKKLSSVVNKINKKEYGNYSEKNIEVLVKDMKSELRLKDYYGIFGMTKPHLELMLWKDQVEKNYSIKLHDDEQVVRVVLLDNFVSLGWAAYATFDNSYTGGWAEKDKLYCVAPSYDLDSEKFNVSYLAHEGRHFSDYKKFPQLKQSELEYRAKLTELSLAKESTYSLIGKFKRGGRPSRNAPHAFANFHVYEQLRNSIFKDRKKWRDVPVEEIQKKAIELLDENTKALTEEGALTVETIL